MIGGFTFSRGVAPQAAQRRSWPGRAPRKPGGDAHV